MNGCKELSFDFARGILTDTCEIQNRNYYDYTTSYFVNLSKVSFNKINNNTDDNFILCKYSLKKEFVSREVLNGFSLGEQEVNLDPNYLYRISVHTNRFDNIKGYQCNVSIGSMSNELAFGSFKFTDTLNVIIPFIIVLIGFGLGFTLLRKLINKSNQGKAL